VKFAKFIDRDLEDSHWQAMIFRHHILSLIEYIVEVEAEASETSFGFQPTCTRIGGERIPRRSKGYGGTSRIGSFRGNNSVHRLMFIGLMRCS